MKFISTNLLETRSKGGNHFTVNKRVNVLGDLRAEHDKQMLETAFYETPDYRTLIESFERPIIVGRRGTGKSALCYELKKFWQKGQNTTVIEIVPEEDQVIGLRPLLSLFGNKYTLIKAGARIAWRYALLLEIASRLIDQKRLSQHEIPTLIFEHVQNWRRLGKTVTERIRELLIKRVNEKEPAETLIAGLSKQLCLLEIQIFLVEMLERSKRRYCILIDRLDEGFEPDELGVALVGGLVHATIDMNGQVLGAQALIFLRDNIFKSLQQLDPDYSRNIEGRFLRLHWDEHQLFDLVCARLRIAFQFPQEDGNRKIWNRCTANELQEKTGFEKCLRLTLYRPRDVLSLLNETFYVAQKQGRKTIILRDVESTAKEISNTRLDDLFKEYAAIIPTLKPLCTVFRKLSPEITYKEAVERIEGLMNDKMLDAAYQREFVIMETAQAGIKTLYSVGFLGIKDAASNAYVFCHDGRSPAKEFQPNDKLMVHPCYWMALELTKSNFDAEEAADIHDEYEVEVFSEAPEIRKRRISQLIAKLDKIPLGQEGAAEFEEWCLRAIKICFTGPLRNIELHPNRNATQRRDIVASNQSEAGAWRRILDDYKSRQVIFEVKNKCGIEPDEYRQVHTYLCDDYGKLGFIITRDKRFELYTGPELDWTRELFNRHKIIVIKLTGSFLHSLLSKMRSNNKSDVFDAAINKLLDVYTRSYFSGAKNIKPPPDFELRSQ